MAQFCKPFNPSCCGGECVPLTGDVTVFVAKKIITMDPSWPDASAVAVQDGRILSVGSLEQLEPWLSKASSVRIDRTFENKVICPGFIDPHQHPLIGGLCLTRHIIAYYDTPNPYGPPSLGLKSKQAVATRLRELVASEKDDILFAWGYDSVALGGHLDADWLDEISTTKPLMIVDASMHYCYCNRSMLKKIGKVKIVPGVGLGEDGKPNGQFLGVRAAQQLLAVMMKDQVAPTMALQAMKHVTDLSHQGGITSIGEMLLGGIFLPLEKPLFQEFYNDTACPMRCVAVLDAKKLRTSCLGSASWATKYVNNLRAQSTEKFIFNGGVKFFSDDAFVGLTMQMTQPGYVDGHKGIWINEPNLIAKTMMPFWKAGLRIHVHSNGDLGQHSTLAALAELQNENPRFDHRFTFEHYGCSTQSISRKVKALGASCSVNVHYPYLRGEINEKHMGVDRAHLAARMQTLVDLGIPTAVHTDVPVAPPLPLQEMWIATERLGQSGKVLAPAERVSRYSALKMITVDAAYILDMDSHIGSIEAGKFADFTILDDDPLTCKDLRSIKVWGTVVGGKKFPVGVPWALSSTVRDGFFTGFFDLRLRWASGLGRWFWGFAVWLLSKFTKKEKPKLQ